MAQTDCIELVTGPGPGYRWCSAAVWLFAALLLAFLAGHLPGPLVLAGAAVLLADLPPRRSDGDGDEHLRLTRHGAMQIGDSAGSWSASAWTTGWLTVLAVRADGCRRRLLIAAWRNDPDHYRVLRTWLRHPPAQPPR